MTLLKGLEKCKRKAKEISVTHKCYSINIIQVMYNALKINRGVINGFNFLRTNKIKRYRSQNDKSTNN